MVYNVIFSGTSKVLIRTKPYKFTKMDIARKISNEHPELVLPKTDPNHLFPKRYITMILLFWGEEDRWFGEFLKKNPSLFDTLSKLSSPIVIAAYFNRIANRNGMFKRRGWMWRGKPSMTGEEKYIRDRETNNKSTKKYHSNPVNRIKFNAWRRLYRQRPDIKAKEAAYAKEYRQRPDIKARDKQYRKERRLKKINGK